MSIGGPLLAVYSFLQNEGYLGNIKTVADIGSMEYQIREPEHDAVFERFFERANAPVPTGRNPETGLYKGNARELYENLGYEYQAFDIDGRFGAHVFDLNYDRVPQELIGWSDLTANLGTIEHVFNQVNSFRVVHDLTKPGGLMLHLSPLNNYMLHGLFQYNPRLFGALAEYNEYAVLGQWVSTVDPSFWLPGSASKRYLAESRLVVTLMQRRGASDFVVPLQIDTPMIVNDTRMHHYGIKEFTAHAPTPPACDLGFKVDFETLESKKMTMDEILADETFKVFAEGGPKSPRARLREARGDLRKKEKLLQKLQAEA